MNDLRTVLDTNVILGSFRSSHDRSPNREILLRWEKGQFVFLYSADILTEYLEKLQEQGFDRQHIAGLVARLMLLGESVSISSFHFRHYPVDPDDTAFLLCALNGSASHLVTYDDDLLSLRHYYRHEVEICEPLLFLAACRSKAGA